MDILLQDLRYCMRMVGKRPGFFSVIIATLALAIGANTAIFSAVNTVLLRPLPYGDPDRLVWIWENNLVSGIEKEPASIPNFADWREQNQVFESIAAFHNWAATLTLNGEPERVAASRVSFNLFSLLRVEPALGRSFLPEEEQPGKNFVVILSYGLWQQYYGSDPNLIGKPINLNGESYTVVGIMPASFRHPLLGDRKTVQLWSPMPINLGQANRRQDFLSVIARLKPSVSLGQARDHMQAIARQLEQQYPETNSGWNVTVINLQDRFVGDIRPAMLVLLGAVGFLLLIACGNVANLLLVHGAGRQKEIGIRVALGAGRGRIIQQLLTESVVLALGAGALGAFIASFSLRALAEFGPSNIARLREVSLDSRVLWFTLLLSLLTGVIFGLMPALHASDVDVNSTLKEGGRSSTGSRRGQRVRSLLAVVEIALALTLLIGAGLMIKSFIRLQDVNPGFDIQRVLAMEISLPRDKYAENHQVVAFYRQLVERVQSMPGVEGAAVVSAVPLGGFIAIHDFSIENRPLPPDGKLIDAQYQVVTSDYFRTMSIPLLSGRVFAESDSADATKVTVINETMARRYWPDEDATGKRIRLEDPTRGPWLTVVGVVRDVRQSELDKEPYPQMYQAYTQVPQRVVGFLVRAGSNPNSLIAALRSEVKALDGGLPLFNVRTMQQVLSDAVSRLRFNMLLISIITGIALVMTVVGIYSVISYSVSQRTHEIGLRMALGAQKTYILRLILGQSFKLALVGVLIGLGLAFALMRVMSSLLYDVSVTDPFTFVAVPFLVLMVALLACYIPARKATEVDPMVSLRAE